MNFQNVMEDSMNFDKNELIFKILFDHAFAQKRSKQVYDIFIRSLNIAFTNRPSFQSIFSDVINDNDDYSSNYSISIALDNSYLPKFSQDTHTLHEFKATG